MEENKIPQTGELFPVEFIVEEMPPPGSGTADTTDPANVFKVIKAKRPEHLAYLYPYAEGELFQKAETYYNNHFEQIREALESSGVSAATITVVLQDYAGVLLGSFAFQATPWQMQEALKGLRPCGAFMIDRYGLYSGLFFHYAKFINVLGQYQNAVTHSDDTATEATRAEFLNKDYSGTESIAIKWLRDVGAIKPAHFVGTSSAEVSRFFLVAFQKGAITEYSNYIFFAKYALMVPPEDLEQIRTPQVQTREPILNYALMAAEQNAKYVNALAGVFTKALETEREEERSKAIQNAKVWERVNTPIVLRETPNIICSRPFEVVPEGDLTLGRYPIQRAIDDFMKRNGDKYGLITSGAIHKAVEGLNYLTNFITPNAAGCYNHRTTINEFCGYAGYTRPNQEQQRQILGALLIIADFYFLVDRPKKRIQVTTKDGNKKTKTVGGPTAARMLDIEIELNQDGAQRGIIIKLKPDIVESRTTLLQAQQYKTLRESAAGDTTKSRFNYQLLTKNHKKEDDLITEIFGYNERLANATTDEERAKALKYIRGHMSENRRKVARWFEEYKQNGILSEYTYDKVKKSYSWARVKPPQND